MSGFAPFGEPAIWEFLLHGLANTAKAAALAILFSVIAGALLGVLRSSGPRIVAWPVTAVVLIIRSLPSYLILLTVFFGVHQLFDWRLSPLATVAIGLATYHGARTSELVRGALQSVERVQVETARALGLSRTQTLVNITWPQASRRMQPPLASECILCVKNTSLGALVGLDDVVRRGEIIYQKYVNPIETLTIIALMYWLICFSLSRLSNRLETSGAWPLD